MRTNIVLDDDIMAEAGKYSQARSKSALVHEALATYVAVKADERKRENYRERLFSLRKKLSSISLKTPARDIVRAERERAG